MAYTSCALATAERSYSVIQQEWLAIVYALKQYLLRCPLTLQTDGTPLQLFLAKIWKYVRMLMDYVPAGIKLEYLIPEGYYKCKCRCSFTL